MHTPRRAQGRISLVYTIRVHPLFKKADELSHLAVGAAIEVHRLKGQALIESIYERCLMRENEAGGRRRADDPARSKPGGVKG